MSKHEVTTLEKLRRDAEMGDIEAQFNLANMYIDGHAVQANDAQAAIWLQRAAEHGHARAQNDLGLMYIKGRGVPQNLKAAAKWLRCAADQGDAIA